MAEDIPSQPFVYEGLDPSPASQSAIEEVSDAIRGTASRVGDAIEKGQKPGMPLSILSNIAREAPLDCVLARCCCGSASLKQQVTEPGLSRSWVQALRANGR